MGKGSPKAPAAPDPYQSAQAQAQVNRLNQFFPGGGSVLYGKYSDDGRFTPDYSHSSVQLIESPYQQQSRDMAERLSLQLANILGGNLSMPNYQSGINFDAINSLPKVSDFSADAKRVEDATFNRVADLLRPQFEQKRSQARQQLSNQGIPMGAEAYDTELSNIDKKQNETLQSAAQDAVAAGRAEQQRLFANALNTRQSQLNDQLQTIGLNNNARANMLQELASLLGGQQFSPTLNYGAINSQPIDVMGAINNNYMGQLNSYNNQNAQNRQFLQSMIGLGGGLFGL